MLDSEVEYPLKKWETRKFSPVNTQLSTLGLISGVSAEMATQAKSCKLLTVETELRVWGGQGV